MPAVNSKNIAPKIPAPKPWSINLNNVVSTNSTTDGGRIWAAIDIICWSKPSCFQKPEAIEREIRSIGKNDWSV